MSRLPSLLKMLESDPADPFLLYGVALEHRKAGNSAVAIDFLQRALAADPGYLYAYYQLGQILESLGQTEPAAAAYRQGIAAAEAKADAHARNELVQALTLLEASHNA